MENCPRCGRIQTPSQYCVKWKENDCIRMGAVIPEKGWFNESERHAKAAMKGHLNKHSEDKFERERLALEWQRLTFTQLKGKNTRPLSELRAAVAYQKKLSADRKKDEAEFMEQWQSGGGPRV